MPDYWVMMARLGTLIKSASMNKFDSYDEADLMPAAIRQKSKQQNENQMIALMKAFGSRGKQ